MEEHEKELDALISGIVGRRVTQTEIAKVLGIGRTTYDTRRKEGRLVTPDSLVVIAGHFELNEVDLLARYGFVSDESCIEYVEKLAAAPHPGLLTTERRPQTTTKPRRRRLSDLDTRRDGVTRL